MIRLLIACARLPGDRQRRPADGPDALFIGKTGDFIQNGAPDGVALVNTANQTILDALSYEGSITAATITGFPGTYNLVEGAATAAADSGDNAALARVPNGTDTNNATADWALATPTPGSPNGGGGATVPGACNHPPQLAAIGDRSVTVGDTLTFTVSATDPDGDPLTFTAVNLPFGSTFDAATHTFSWTPAAQVGTYAQVHFSTSDGRAGDAEDIAITVNPAAAPTTSTTPTHTGSTPTAVQPPAAASALDTKIAKVTVKKRAATVSFSGSGGAKTFQCKLDKGRFAACKSPKTYKKLKRGKHVVQVRAVDAAGKPDATPAKTSFRVKR